jgi:hypothetical protein
MAGLAIRSTFRATAVVKRRQKRQKKKKMMMMKMIMMGPKKRRAGANPNHAQRSARLRG